MELSQNGKLIGKLERDGGVWYWEAYNDKGAIAAGWQWTEGGALERLRSMREGE